MAPAHYTAWLDPTNTDIDALLHLLQPYPADEMAAISVSTRVNDVKNDGPELLDRV